MIKYTGFHRALEIDHRSHRSSWQVHVSSLIEADRLDVLRASYRSRGLRAPSYTAIVVKGIALALEDLRPGHPELNSYLRNILGWKRIVPFEGISGGVSTALSRLDGTDDESCVAVGVVQEPQRKPLLRITEELASFSDPASPFVVDTRRFHAVPGFIQRIAHWLSRNLTTVRYERRGTFCLNPIGKFGVDVHLSLPQTSSLQFGMGRVRERVVARAGAPAVVSSFYLTLSFDRRLMNGRPAARLMDRIQAILSQGEFPGESRAGGEQASLATGLVRGGAADAGADAWKGAPPEAGTERAERANASGARSCKDGAK